MTSAFRLLRTVASLPADAILRKTISTLRNGSANWFARRRDWLRGTWSGAPDGIREALFVPPKHELLEAQRTIIEALTGQYLAHQFDLLGSGWVRVQHGMECRGLEGHRYGPSPAVVADKSGTWLANWLPPGALPEARRIWSLIDPDYRPIDWQLDFKSGYRWSEKTWFRDIRFGHLPGVDVKVPWELARGQHLPLLALCFGLDQGKGERAELCLRELQSQILDFIATNPPRFGVNWRVPMDVAIRAVNWIAAVDLFAGYGAIFPTEFQAVLARSLHEHGAHVRDNLEWDPRYRANHYLADVVGLLFIGAALGRKEWFEFAASEVLAETEFQFLPDGGGFEASTCYHRLSAEMVGYATALLLRAERATPDPEKLARIFAFSRLLRKPSENSPQVGDNDSGRLFKFVPASKDVDGVWQENSLDHRHLDDLAAGLAGCSATLEAALVMGLTRGRSLELPAVSPIHSVVNRASARESSPTRVVRIRVRGGGLRHDLRTFAWPDFGLYLFRSSRIYLLVRCGPIGVNGRGPHAHNDQLAVELSVDGVDWLTDPGSYVYTALPERRDQYRSVHAHCAPQLGDLEPGRLTLGDFWLGNEAQAECLAFGPLMFEGAHRGFGKIVVRRVIVHDDHISIVDSGTESGEFDLIGRDATQALLQPKVPFSPGYGRIAP